MAKYQVFWDSCIPEDDIVKLNRDGITLLKCSCYELKQASDALLEFFRENVTFFKKIGGGK